MRAYEYQIWFNVVKDNVQRVIMVGASNKEEALTILSKLRSKKKVKEATLRNKYGQWMRFDLGGANE